MPKAADLTFREIAASMLKLSMLKVMDKYLLVGIELHATYTSFCRWGHVCVELRGAVRLVKVSGASI